MKLNLLVDAAYALDYCAILFVKNSNAIGDNKKKLSEEVDNVCAYIAGQIGISLFEEILGSKEWEKLIEANSEVFKGVDKAKTNSITAFELDRLNFARYLAKIELQRKFFNSEVTEQKIGY